MPGGKLRALWRKWRDRPEHREQELLSQPASPAVGSKKPETIPIPSSQAASSAPSAQPARSYGNKSCAHADKTCGFDDSLPAPAEATRGLGVSGSTQEARPPLAASLSAGVPSCQPRQATNSGDDACRQGPAGAAPHRASSLGALPPCHLLVPARYTGSARRSSCCAPVLPSSTLEGEISTQTSVESYDRALIMGEAVSPEFGTPGWERALTQQIAACTGLSTTASSRRASESAGFLPIMSTSVLLSGGNALASTHAAASLAYPPPLLPPGGQFASISSVSPVRAPSQQPIARAQPPPQPSGQLQQQQQQQQQQLLLLKSMQRGSVQQSAPQPRAPRRVSATAAPGTDTPVEAQPQSELSFGRAVQGVVAPPPPACTPRIDGAADMLADYDDDVDYLLQQEPPRYPPQQDRARNSRRSSCDQSMFLDAVPAPAPASPVGGSRGVGASASVPLPAPLSLSPAPPVHLQQFRRHSSTSVPQPASLLSGGRSSGSSVYPSSTLPPLPQSHSLALPPTPQSLSVRVCNPYAAQQQAPLPGFGQVVLPQQLLHKAAEHGANLHIDLRRDVAVDGSRALGSGQFGTVFAGIYRGAPVAVKSLRPLMQGCTIDDLEVFVQEVTVLCTLRHPSIVQLLGACLQPPDICLVEELCATSLDAVLHRRDTVRDPAAATYAPAPTPATTAAAAAGGHKNGSVTGSMAAGGAGGASPFGVLAAAFPEALAGLEGASAGGASGRPSPSHSRPSPVAAGTAAAGAAPVPVAQPPARGSPLPLFRVLEIALDVALGMQYLHSRAPAVVHRDLKPSNILLDAEGRAKIGDFGLARLAYNAYIDTARPETGSMAYMAPECWDPVLGGGLTDKMDIFSYGVVLWELCTGERPWAHCRTTDFVSKVVSRGARLPVPTNDNACPYALRCLISSCTEERPSERPAVAHIVAELRRMLKYTRRTADC